MYLKDFNFFLYCYDLAVLLVTFKGTSGMSSHPSPLGVPSAASHPLGHPHASMAAETYSRPVQNQANLRHYPQGRIEFFSSFFTYIFISLLFLMLCSLTITLYLLLCVTLLFHFCPPSCSPHSPFIFIHPFILLFLWKW